MIKIMMPIPDIDSTITRPITTSVIEQLKRVTGIPIAMDIANPGENGALPQTDSVIQQTGYDRDLTGFRTSSRSMINITVEDNLVADHVLATPIMKSDAEFIFHDDKLGIVMIPTYALSKLTINIALRFGSKKAANSWMQQLNAKISTGLENIRHTLTYSYNIPHELLFLLMKVHELRENQAGYGDTLQDWLKESFNKRLRIVTNTGGKQATFTIAEDQIDASGRFDTEIVPQPQSGNEVGSYVFNLTYEVMYRRPTNVIIEYPELIHNQYLPKPFDGDGITESFDFSSVDLWGGAFAVLGLQQNSLHMPVPWQNFGMRVPWYDRWKPSVKFPMSKPIVTLLCNFAPDDMTEIVDLHDLVMYTFDEDIMVYLEEAGDSILRIGGAPIKVTLFRDDIPKSDHWLTMDENLLVSVFEEVDLRQIYRLQISLYCGLASIPEASKQILIKHGRAVHKFMLAACPNMAQHGLPPIAEDGSVSLKDYMLAARKVEDCVSRREVTSDSAWTLVGLFSIVTERKTS